MPREHRARITWSAAHEAHGLPTVVRMIDPAWPPGVAVGAGPGDVWSLLCQFDRPPAEQGSPSLGVVRFWMDEAPHDTLRPGAVLQLFERATGTYARVEILE